MKVTFTGDISITGSFTPKITSNSEIFSDALIAHLKNTDFVIGNLEGATTNATEIYNNNTPLKSPTNTINYLKDRNITVFNLSNNHILDYGAIGLKDTFKEIDKENCTSFGASLTKEKHLIPEIIEKNGITIALFGIAKCTPTNIDNAKLFNADDFASLKKQIKIYSNKVDFIIVNFHGGEEFSLFPSPTKRKFLKKIAALKEVNCVIAHHSHTFQGYEKYKNTYIFYSLGNFIFDLKNHKPYKNTSKSALLNLFFTKHNFTFNFTPFQIDEGKINLTNQEIFEEELKYLCNFSDYRKKWQKEAFRILFRKENPQLKETLVNNTALQNKSFFGVLISKKFYNKIATIIKDEYLFSLYLNAIIYKIKKKFVL